jgi:hypothetical protein
MHLRTRVPRSGAFPIAMVLILVVEGCALGIGTTRGQLEIANRAAQPATISIQVGPERLSADLRPQESVILPFKIHSDAHYDVSVSFGDGKNLARSLGYVTNGMEEFDRMTITEEDVHLDVGTIASPPPKPPTTGL